MKETGRKLKSLSDFIFNFAYRLANYKNYNLHLNNFEIGHFMPYFAFEWC